jgi:hypothetical protein
MEDEMAMETMQQAEPPTFESVWAMMQENNRKWEENKRKWEENERKWEKKREENERKWEKTHEENERKREENDRKWEDTKRYLKRLSKQMGDLHNSFGDMAEHLVVPSIADRFNEIGYHFSRVMPGGERILDEQKKIRTEVDILLENDDSIVAIEVKARVGLKDIGHHARRLEILREDRDKLNDRRIIRGAIAGAIFGSTEKAHKLEAVM